MPKKTTRRRACEGARPVSANRRSEDQPPAPETHRKCIVAPCAEGEEV
jgi:hypothetical protein